MAGKSAVLALKITGDASDARRALDETGGMFDGFGRKVAGLGALIGGAFVVDKVLDFGKSAFTAASDLEQMQGSLDAVFGALGDSRVQMTKWSLDADKSVGLSSRAYDQVASVIGSQLKNAGVPMDELAGKTNGLIQQGADMSAVFGGTAADAVEALSSVLKGEFDPIEKYGVSINASAISAELAARGQDKLTGSALKQAQVQAALDLVTKQTAQTQGQFAAQSGTAAEKAQTLSAWFDNLQAKIGSYLLPVFVSLVDFFSTKVGPVFDRVTSDTGVVGIALGTAADFVTYKLVPAVLDLYNFLAPKLVPIFQIIGGVLKDDVVPAFQKVSDIVQNYVLPILKSVLGPALEGLKDAWGKLAGALEDNRDKFDKIYNNLKPFLDFLKNNLAPFVGGALRLAFEALGKSIGPVVDAIAWVLEKASKVTGIIGSIGGAIGGLFGSGKPSAGASNRGAAPLFGAARTGGGRLFGAAGSLGGGVGPTAAGGLIVPVGDTYNITVTGALDPAAVADQIGRLLDERARRVGAAPAFSVAR